jgi:hypothetical protein
MGHASSHKRPSSSEADLLSIGERAQALQSPHISHHGRPQRRDVGMIDVISKLALDTMIDVIGCTPLHLTPSCH